MKLCPYPFSRLETSNYSGRADFLKGRFLPCVPAWFKHQYFNIKTENNLDDIWNGVAAQELRSRMYAGDFSLCNRSICQIPLFEINELANNQLTFQETPISEKNLEAIKNKLAVLPDGPTSISLTSDFTCNLKCPICRDKYFLDGESSKEAIEEIEYVKKHSSILEVIKMSNGGEVFYSSLQKNLIKSFNNVDFPKLKRVHIVTNAVLFNSKLYEELSPGIEYIKDVNISLDAASEEVYQKVRGPNWKQVRANLDFISKLRMENKIEFLSIHFVVVRENYNDILKVLDLAQSLNFDRVLFLPYHRGPDQGYKNYVNEAVHLESHPEYNSFLEIMKLAEKHPLFYTNYNFLSSAKKMKVDVNNKKSFGFFMMALEKEKVGEYSDALYLINKSLELNESENALKLKEILLNKTN